MMLCFFQSRDTKRIVCCVHITIRSRKAEKDCSQGKQQQNQTNRSSSFISRLKTESLFQIFALCQYVKLGADTLQEWKVLGVARTSLAWSHCYFKPEAFAWQIWSEAQQWQQDTTVVMSSGLGCFLPGRVECWFVLLFITRWQLHL